MRRELASRCLLRGAQRQPEERPRKGRRKITAERTERLELVCVACNETLTICDEIDELSRVARVNIGEIRRVRVKEDDFRARDEGW